MPGQCFRCKEEVHVAEERLALGSSWHLECFTCAICNKTLDSTNMYESSKAQEIYCRPCYKKHYCIPGYGFGPTKPTLLSVLPSSDTISGVTGQCPCSPCCPCDTAEAAAAPNEVFVPPPSRQGQEYTPRLPVPRHYGNQVVRATCPCSKCDAVQAQMDSRSPNPRAPSYNVSYLRQNDERCQRPEISRQPSQRRQSSNHPAVSQQSIRRDSPAPWSDVQDTGQRSPRPQTTANCTCVKTQSSSRRRNYSRTKSAGRTVPICQKCGREVFFAEQVMGYRGYYHVRCFICYCCGKTLDSTTVNEHQGQLYCKGCYKHKYATIGVGYGIGAGTLQTP